MVLMAKDYEKPMKSISEQYRLIFDKVEEGRYSVDLSRDRSCIVVRDRLNGKDKIVELIFGEQSNRRPDLTIYRQGIIPRIDLITIANKHLPICRMSNTTR